MFLLKNINISLGEGALFSLVAIVIVFAILILIVFCVKALQVFKKEKVEEPVNEMPVVKTTSQKKLTFEDITDEDMMVAALIATAEFVEETKETDARLVSIKQIG